MGQLKNWVNQDWVRIDSQGNIAGECGTSKNKKNPDRCLPRAKAESLTKEERKSTAQKKKQAGAKGQTVVANTPKARVRANTGGTMIKNKSKADLNKDGKLSSYETKRGMAIEKAMKEQNRAKMKNGGFIARGCGAVRDDKRKVTTMSQEKIMPKKKSEDPKLQARLDAKVRPDESVSDDRIFYNMPKKKAPAKKTTTKKGKK